MLESQPPIDLPLFRLLQPNVATRGTLTLRNPTPHGNQCSTLAEGMLESGILEVTTRQPSFVGARAETRPENREKDENLALFRLQGSCAELKAGFEARDMSSTCPSQACLSGVSTARLRRKPAGSPVGPLWTAQTPSKGVKKRDSGC